MGIDYPILVCLEPVLIHARICEICPGQETSAASLAAGDNKDTRIDIEAR